MQGTFITNAQLRPRLLFLAMGALAFFAMLALVVASAQAARVHPLQASENLPNGEFPSDLAVDQATHHLYVVGADGSGNLRVYNLQADGTVDPVHPELTGAPWPSPFNVAVDNSASAHAEYIYVVNVTNLFNSVGNVQQFDPEGKATAVTITGAAIPPAGTAQAGGLPPVVNKGSLNPRVVAVDGSGNVFVTDIEAEAIDVFTPAGAFVRQIAAGVIGAFPAGIALDSSGHIYIARKNPDAIGPGLFELDASSGECVQSGCAPIDPAPAYGVAVDNATGAVYTTGLISDENGGEGKFSEYEAATGKRLGVTHPAALRQPGAIAVDEASGKVFISDTPPHGGTLKIFGALEIVPDVETLTPEEATDRSVTLKGEIGAAEVNGATCTFQYVDEAAFKAHGFEGAAEAPCEENDGHPAGPYSGTEMHEVEAKISGLRGGATYHERILGKNLNGTNPGEDIPFITKGPSVSGTEVAEVEEDGATLQALVDPNGLTTAFRFQYLTQAQFESSGWSAATDIPASGESLGSGASAIAVSERIEGLVPGNAYRFRVLAESSGGEGAGETKGAEVVFTTFSPPLSGLPDSRRYEQASPTDKNGTNVQGGINSVQASLDGGRVTFFANGGIPGGEGAQQFPTFMASRATDGSGWSTRGLLPPASYGPRAEVVGWSEDLSDTYTFATQPFQAGKLLRRQSQTGALTEVATVDAKGNPFALAATSEGGAVALLESNVGGLLEGDTVGQQNVYAYDRETVQLALVGTMNDGSAPAAGAVAGGYEWFQKSTKTGTGGAFGYYFTQAAHTLSADGSKAFFTSGDTGQIYARLNPFAPQSAMSGDDCTEPLGACTIRVSAPEEGITDPGTPAAFLGASADGNRVYFLDKGKLTTDATGGSGYDLYRYDVPSGELTALSLDHADRGGARVEGMLAIGGPRGEDAYFVAAGKLAEGTTQAPGGETNLYALHGTAMTYVTRLGTTGEAAGDAVDWLPSSKFVLTGSITSNSSRVSSDGQVLLFRSQLPQTSYDSHGVSELYLYSAGQGISCVSCNPTGEAPAGPAGVQEIPGVGFTQARKYNFSTRNLSADGRRVFFDSTDRLVASDRNDVNDVYEWEAEGKGSCESEAIGGGCLYLISGGGEGDDPSWFGDADEGGENVFFFTSQALVAQDRDELVDVYDARIGGGIAAQEQEPPLPCEGEAGCRGSAPPAPNLPTPGSSSFAGPGNPKPASRCPKGKMRKNGRCVSKHQKKKSKQSKDNGKRPHARGKAGGR